MSEPIIRSLIDSDLYKLTMQQAVFHQYRYTRVKYQFRCRNSDIKLGFLKDAIISEVRNLADLRLKNEEANFLSKQGFFKDDYIEFLSDFTFNPYLCEIKDNKGDLSIEIGGAWLDTILFEVPLLAIVNELYFNATTDFNAIKNEGKNRLLDKIELIKTYPDLMISEFGTRRRYSSEWQRYVFSVLKDLPNIIGTSNVKLAQEFNAKPIGTMAHEYISAHIGLVDNLSAAQNRAFHVWLQEYDRDLAIALTDTFTTKAFFKDFGYVLANAYSGVRHDSGDPIKFGHDTLAFYNSKGIDPKTKTIVFSDGLNIPEAIRIFEEFNGLIKLSFGIGTNLTNDLGPKALNIVIKLIKCNGEDCVKLSDNVGKAIGNPFMIEAVKKSYGVSV